MWVKLGKKPKVALQPDNPPPPDAIAYLWGWFVEVSYGMGSGGFGPAMLTWECLRAWCELTGRQIEPWEAQALMRLSVLRATVVSEKKD